MLCAVECVRENQMAMQDSPLEEESYHSRKPSPPYCDIKALESSFAALRKPGVTVSILAAGLMYGREEQVFHTLFKVVVCIRLIWFE